MKKYADTFRGAGEVTSSSELHRHVRAGGHVSPGWRRLLPGYAAAYGFQFEARIFSRFYGPADGLADK